MKKAKAYLPAAFLLSLSIMLSAGANGQTVSISPSSQSVSLHSMSTVTFNVSVSSVTNLYGFQHDVLYNQTVLNVTALSSVTEGPFLKSGGVSTYFISGTLSPGWVRNTACTRMSATSGASGSGNLTRITFSVNLGLVTPINSYVRLVNTKLSDINSAPITHSAVNATVNIYECLSGETKACGSNIGECRSGTQNCLAGNTWNATCGGAFRGPSNEICNGLDDDCDGQADENVTGTGNLSRSCSVTHYGICAVGNEICNGAGYAGCPAPQTEICNNGVNEDCDPTGDSICRGDVNQNGCIDITDLSIVALDFGKTPPFTDPRSDIDTNNVVDIFDLVYVGKDFGAGCP